MLTKDHIDTLVLIVVVCVLDEDKNPTDCVPYDDFVSEDAPSRSKRIVNR